MDTSKAKKQTKKEEPEVRTITVYSHGVENVRVVSGKNGDVVFFTLELNGIYIYNCRVASGKNGDFISFPQTEGKDGKYYSIVYVRLSDKDSKEILDAIQEKINEDDVPFK